MSEATRRRVRVAVVDDSEDMRLLLRVMLERDDRFEIVGEAKDGLEAIDLVDATQPDLVVLDRQMPRMGGVEALPHIRERAPAAAVVVYTAGPDSTSHHAAFAAGATDVVTKDVIGDALINQLAAALLGHWSSTAGEVQVHVGPVDSSAALVWINNTRCILDAVRRKPDVLDHEIPHDVFDTFTRFLDTWNDVAATNPTFVWVARADTAEVNRLVTSWAAIDRLSDDALHRLGCDWSPPAGEPFFRALTAGILDAMAAHEETRRLADELRPAWQD